MDLRTRCAMGTTVLKPGAKGAGTGWFALVCLLVVAPPAQALEMSTVRVRIVEAAARVEIVDGAGTSHSVTATRSGIVIDGRAVGKQAEQSGRGPYRVRADGGEHLEVRGSLRLRHLPGRPGVEVINVVGLENYVAGTLGGEMLSSWQAAALAAQAIACRSYVVYQMDRRTGERYDVAADISSQRYLGVRGESDAGWRAVHATAGSVLRYQGAAALAAFHSASGGQTASAQEVWGESVPYLQSVPVANEDDSPDTYWRAAVPEARLSQGLSRLGHAIGHLEALEVTERSESGRVREVRFRGSRGRAKVTGRELRRVLGSTTIKSTLFEVRRLPGEVVFVGSGFGHGVGMSQWAAQAMALEGAPAQEILAKFYPGTTIEMIAKRTQLPRFATIGPKRMQRTRLEKEGRNRMGEQKR